MANNTNSNQPLPKRKEIVADFKRIYHDSLKEEYSEEYRSLAQQMYRFAQKVASAPITSKNKETISTIKNNQRDFLLNMKSLLDTIRTDTGKKEVENQLEREHIEQIQRRMHRTSISYGSANIFANHEADEAYKAIMRQVGDIYSRVEKSYRSRVNQNNQKIVQESAYDVMNDLLKENERHMDYPGISALQTLVSLPLGAVPQEKEKLEEFSRRASAQADVGNSANRLAALICPMHAVDPDTGTTKCLSHEDLTNVKSAYDDLIEKINEYRKLLPEQHEYQSDLATIAVNLVQERTQVERAIQTIEKLAGKNEELKNSARPFSIYEIEGRTNPEFNNTFFRKAQTVQRTGAAFRARVTQWKQDDATRQMLQDYDSMMSSFDHLSNDVLPQLMKLDRGDRGYLPAMTPEEVANLRDAYQEVVIKIDQFAKSYGKKPKNQEQKDFQAALSGLYFDMVDKFRMLDQLAGGEDVKDLSEALDILNAKKEELEHQEAPKKEKQQKEKEEKLQQLSEEEQRLKDTGYYQTLLNDGQLFPQMLFDSTESQRSADLAALRRETQILSGTRKNFNEIMTRNRRMRACPDTAVFDTALAVDPDYPLLTDEDKEGFNKHFDLLKKQAMELAAKMSVYYEPDENGRTKLLNMDEIRELDQAYRDLATESFMCEGWLPKGDPRKAAFTALEKMCDERVTSLRAAAEYIEKNAPEYREAQPDQEHIVPRTRAFSLYELQGGMNPEIDNNAVDTVAQFKEEMDAFEMGLNKLSTKQLRQIDPIRAEYKTFAREIDNLYNNVIPDMLRMHPESSEFSKTVTRDKVQEALKEFEKATMAFIPLRVDYDRRVSSKNPPITKEEEAMYKTAQQLYLRVSEKWLAMNYLLDRRAEELKQDIDRHNVQVDELREELKKFKDNQQLPEAQRKKDLQLKHDAKFLSWAMQLEDLYLNKKLIPAAFFEDDPSAGRSHLLSELRLTEKNIQDVQMRAFYLGAQKWDEKGKRDLGGVQEFQASLHQRNEFGTHTVMQYATKGKTSVKEIMETALKTLPAKLRGKEFNAVIDEKFDATIGKFGGYRRTYQKMTVEQAIRFYYDKKVRESTLTGKEEFIALDINNDDIHALGKCGFANVFAKEELEDNRTLLYFVTDLNRALLNAGCCHDTYDLHTDPYIPDGYNQGYAKIAAQALNDDLALRKSPEKGKIVLEDRNDQYGNKPAANLLPETRLWEQTKFQYGEARKEQAFDVVIASTEKNYAEQVPGDKTREFYTTTKNFRSSSFVGFTSTSVTEMPQYAQDMTAEELAQAEIEVERYFYSDQTGKNKKIDPSTADVDDYRSYQDPTVLANAADLQVMGYLLGIPKYKADTLRIGFKLNAKGKPEVSNVLGTETDDFLFSSLAPDDPSLVSPDDMLVMTAEMAQKVLDWSEGRFDANERAVKESLMRLPAKAREAFQKRLQVMAAKVRESEAYKDTFDDVISEEKKPGTPELLGLQTKRGIIRVLDRRDFNQLKMDDLAIGRNSGDYRTRETKPPVNIFDAVADLPKQSHLALMDKWAATWSGGKSKEFGHMPESDMGKSNWKRTIHEPMYERQFLESERHRSLMKMKRMVGDVVRMDRNRKNESFFHWDTGKYTDVLKAQEELDNALTLYDLDHTVKTAQATKQMIEQRRWELQKNDDYFKRWKEVHDANRKIADENAKIFAKNLDIKDKSKHIPLKPYLPLPVRERLPEEEQVRNKKYVHDYRDLKPVKDAMLKLKKKLEIYLTARVNPSSEFGKMRYATMLKMYNDINNRLADYITYSGDTRDLPSTAKLVEIPPKDGQPVPDDKKKYKIVYEPMMEPAEWELRIPDVVRQDYIRAVKNEIMEKARKSKKDDAIDKAQSECRFAEATIKKRYEQAKKVYDLNGRKKDVGFLDDFDNVESYETIVKEVKNLDPRKVRPVILKNPKNKKEALHISAEEQRKQASNEYQRLIKGGKKQGGFDFATMSEVQPEPEPKIIVNPPRKEAAKPKVKDIDLKSIMDKELQRRGNRNNKGTNNKDAANQIKNTEKKNDNLIINNEKKEDNLIINTEKKEDHPIINNEKKDGNPIINNEKKEDNPIINNEKKEDKPAANNGKKNSKVNELDFDEVFKDIVPNNPKPEIHRPANNQGSTELNSKNPKVNGPTNSK
ncbi:MAG: hypothetical protein K5696_06290 [Lachnospiraceae bacterium]|nr:hypothetical protein [Lachnospiraceae bacterium]